MMVKRRSLEVSQQLISDPYQPHRLGWCLCIGICRLIKSITYILYRLRIFRIQEMNAAPRRAMQLCVQLKKSVHFVLLYLDSPTLLHNCMLLCYWSSFPANWGFHPSIHAFAN